MWSFNGSVYFKISNSVDDYGQKVEHIDDINYFQNPEDWHLNCPFFLFLFFFTIQHLFKPFNFHTGLRPDVKFPSIHISLRFSVTRIISRSIFLTKVVLIFILHQCIKMVPHLWESLHTGPVKTNGRMSVSVSNYL